MNKYDLIYIDPPFWYNSRNNVNKTKFGGGASKHYPLMRDQELLDMKPFIDNISNDNCIMFMWVTAPRLEFALKLLNYWSFKYKTKGFTWIKINKNGSPRINPGYYTASNSEDCIIAIKGKNNGRFTPHVKMINQVIFESLREHSRKPDSVRHYIELMYPELSKIELFARQKFDNWDSWGNEITN
jgi:N6-adenosine-specific RNA methylase IME4